MSGEFLARLTTSSTIAEVPGHEETLEITARARDLAELFRAKPQLPGVLLTRDGRLESAISRRYYLDTVGRHLGMDLYLPRPIEVMLARFRSLGGALVLDGDVPIPEVVRQGLARRRELTYEPVVVRPLESNGSHGRLIDFEDLLLADSQLTALRGHQMRQILTTVQEGLLLAARDQRISAEYSTATEKILELGRIAGRSLRELLSEGLDTERCDLARDYLESLFDPRVIESLVVKINPLLKVTWQRAGSRPRVLSFRFARGIEEGEIRRVLIRIEDVTRAEELAAEVEQERARAESRLTLAIAAVQIEPEVIEAFLAALDRQRERALDLAHGGAPPADAVGGLFRRVHALKGEAGLMRLESFQSALHGLEDELARLRDAGELRRDALLARLAALADLTSEVRQLRARLAGGAHPAGTQSVPLHVGVHDRAGALERSIAELAEKVAGDLGKKVNVISRIEPEALEAQEGLLREALVQLVRNAVAHGVEPAGRRLEAGKEESGTVQVVARRDAASGWIEVVVQDDGRGLDLEVVRERAGAAAEGLDDDQLADLVFRPGFSTAESAGQHAGRGFGLDLVKERVEEAGGTIEVHSESGLFCAFRILLPGEIAEAM